MNPLEQILFFTAFFSLVLLCIYIAIWISDCIRKRACLPHPERSLC